jgi:hypothetical protein
VPGFIGGPAIFFLVQTGIIGAENPFAPVADPFKIFVAHHPLLTTHQKPVFELNQTCHKWTGQSSIFFTKIKDVKKIVSHGNDRPAINISILNITLF